MKRSNGSFFSDQKTPSFRRCKICNGKHGIWSCEVFQRMDINNKWNAVKKEKLCFCCLGDDHYSKDSKEEENVEYKIVTRVITSCYIFRRKMIQQKEVEMEQVDKIRLDQTK